MRFTILSTVAAAFLIAGTTAVPVPPNNGQVTDPVDPGRTVSEAPVGIIEGNVDGATAPILGAADPGAVNGLVPLPVKRQADQKPDEQGQGQGQQPSSDTGNLGGGPVDAAKSAIKTVEQAAADNPAISDSVKSTLATAQGATGQGGTDAIGNVAGVAGNTGI